MGNTVGSEGSQSDKGPGGGVGPRSGVRETPRGVGGEPRPKDPEVLMPSNPLRPCVKMTTHRERRGVRKPAGRHHAPRSQDKHGHFPPTQEKTPTEADILSGQNHSANQGRRALPVRTRGRFEQRTANTAVSGERLKAPPTPTPGTRRGRPLLPSDVLDAPDGATGQEKRQETPKVERRR